MGNATSLAIVVALTGSAAADEFIPERIDLRLAGELGEDTQSLSLDGWYSVNHRFRVGLTSSTDARHELGAGRGLCLNDCAPRYGGLAAESQIRLSPNLIGRAAIDTTRFAPTAAAVELGIDAHYAAGPWSALIAPVLHLGIARRDLANRDTAALLLRLSARLWPTGGAFAIVRGGLALDDLRGTPTFGYAGGAYLELGDFTITARFGVVEVSDDHVFGELALGWSG